MNSSISVNPLKYFLIPINRLRISKSFFSPSRIKPFHNHWITKCLKRLFFFNKNDISSLWCSQYRTFDSWKLCSVLERYLIPLFEWFSVPMEKFFFVDFRRVTFPCISLYNKRLFQSLYVYIDKFRFYVIRKRLWH